MFQGIHFDILEGYYFNEGFNDTINYVIKELYDLRTELKAKKNPAEQAYKLFMNSMYGIKLLNPIDTDNKALRSKSYYNIARILQDKNEIEQSLSFYRKSLELNPNDMDTKINYELLKNQMKQHQKQEDNQNKENNDNQNDESQQNQDQSNNEDENNSQENESKSEQYKNENKEEDKNEMVENDSSKQAESQTKETDQNANDQPLEENKNKSDELMQAEAILNALKDQEKINQKQKILKTKSFKFDKDW